MVLNKCYNTLKSTGRSARSKKFFFLCLTCWRMHSNKPFYYCFHCMYFWCPHISWIRKNKKIILFLQVNIYIYMREHGHTHTQTHRQQKYIQLKHSNKKLCLPVSSGISAIKKENSLLLVHLPTDLNIVQHLLITTHTHK